MFNNLCKYFFCCFFALICTISGGYAYSSSRINPNTDLVYMGAFQVPPDTSNGTKWSYGGGGLSYFSSGDISGKTDGFPGSLYGVGRTSDGYVSEYSIPSPEIHQKVEDLPLAESLQSFQNLVDDLNLKINIDGGYRMGDIQILDRQGAMGEDKLLWVLYQYYMPPPDLPTFGWSGLTLSDSQSEGLARISSDTSSATSRYIFKIPKDWADQYTGGRNIAVGRFRGQSGGSLGPTIFAIDPTTKPHIENGQLWDSTTLLRYNDGHAIPYFSRGGEEWSDGAWITIGDKSSVIIAGGKGVRTEEGGDLYYGPPGIDGCGSKGYHAEPYYAAILFYDPDDLADVAMGKAAAHDVVPYAYFIVDKYMFNGFSCRRKMLGGVGYDEKNQILYIEELEVGNGINIYDKSPVVHVWKVIDGGAQELDKTPPTAPSNIAVSDISKTEKRIAWNSAADDSGTIYYIIYRNNEPIAMTGDTFYVDDRFHLNPELTQIEYTVEARDAMNNSSSQGTRGDVIEERIPEPPSNLGIIE